VGDPNASYIYFYAAQNWMRAAAYNAYIAAAAEQAREAQAAQTAQDAGTLVAIPLRATVDAAPPLPPPEPTVAPVAVEIDASTGTDASARPDAERAEHAESAEAGSRSDASLAPFREREREEEDAGAIDASVDGGGFFVDADVSPEEDAAFVPEEDGAVPAPASGSSIGAPPTGTPSGTGGSAPTAFVAHPRGAPGWFWAAAVVELGAVGFGVLVARKVRAVTAHSVPPPSSSARSLPPPHPSISPPPHSSISPPRSVPPPSTRSASK
jgi:hypothetical protein